VVGRAEQALLEHNEKGARNLLDEKEIAAAPTPEAKRKLELLRSLLDPTEPVDLQSTKENKVLLSDAAWSDAKVGWGEPARNHFWFGKENRGGILLNMDGRFVDKALFAHSPSRYVFPVAEKWKSFTAKVGLCDGTLYFGAAVFEVKGDGKELFKSRVLKDGQSQQVKIDISQVETLELVTELVEGSVMAPWAIWVDPQVER
jgi:NPCBM/NEW2 domain